MDSHPWFKFHPRDWRSDPALQSCSLAARGLWIELCSIMHDASTYGHLVLGDRYVPTHADIARLVGSTPDEIGSLLGELIDRGVARIGAHGMIYSKRMVADRKRYLKAVENGKKGGNPLLKEKGGKGQGVNPLLSSSSDLCSSEEEEGSRDPRTTDYVPPALEVVRDPSEPQWAKSVRCPDCGQDLRLMHGVYGWYYAHPRWYRNTCDWRCDAEDYDRASQEQEAKPVRVMTRVCPYCGDPIRPDQCECDACRVSNLPYRAAQ